MTKLYHREVFAPEKLFGKLHGRALVLEFSSHARQACRNDRYGFIIPPTHLVVNQQDIIEVEENDGQVEKVVIRLPYSRNNQFDLVLAVKPDGFVKTVWLNERKDAHKTLDVSRYQRA
jgi:hypothetical protein